MNKEHKYCGHSYCPICYPVRKEDKTPTSYFDLKSSSAFFKQSGTPLSPSFPVPTAAIAFLSFVWMAFVNSEIVFNRQTEILENL